MLAFEIDFTDEYAIEACDHVLGLSQSSCRTCFNSNMAFAFFVSAVLLLSGATAANFDEEEGVLVLTDANFEEAIATHHHILVEFCV